MYRNTGATEVDRVTASIYSADPGSSYTSSHLHLILSYNDNTYSIFPNFISKMYFSHWKPPGGSERMCSVNLDASISGEYQTLRGHSYWPSE